jgi:HEAT repeats
MSLQTRCSFCQKLPVLARRKLAKKTTLCPLCRGELFITSEGGASYRLAAPGEAVATAPNPAGDLDTPARPRWRRRAAVLAGLAMCATVCGFVIASLAHRADEPIARAATSAPASKPRPDQLSAELTRANQLAALHQQAEARLASGGNVQPAQGGARQAAPAEDSRPTAIAQCAGRAKAAPGPRAGEVAWFKSPPIEEKDLAAKVAAQRWQSARDQEEALRKALARVPELSLAVNRAAAEQPGGATARTGEGAREIAPEKFIVRLVKERPAFAALPLRMGPQCQLDNTAARILDGHSKKLRRNLAEANGWVDRYPKRLGERDGEVAAYLSNLLVNPQAGEWGMPRAVPTLQQLLVGENHALRLVLVDVLRKIKGEAASQALAQRAVFDLNPAVRAQARLALQERPNTEYVPTLLDAFHYPWAPAAAHAAEALVDLNIRDAVPRLIDLLDEPDPGAPFLKENGGKQVLVVRELVRINHLSNCLLCHAPSLSPTDLVRGLVPVPGQALPPLSAPYYAGRSGTFVRADVTYLRQDFSVLQPVADAGQWPTVQRFDYVVRTRPLSDAEAARHRAAVGPQPPSDHTQAVLAALRDLTGRDAGVSATAWRQRGHDRAPARAPASASSSWWPKTDAK